MQCIFSGCTQSGTCICNSIFRKANLYICKDEQKTVVAQSAVKGMVYTYSTMLTKGDCIFYLKEIGGENLSYCLYCQNVTIGI